MSTPDCTISLLADMPHAVPELAGWFLAEWEPYYGPDGPGDATADITECLNRDSIPLALVACDQGGNVVGTAALKQNSVGDDICDGPWLAALLVRPGYRNRSIGSALVEAIESHARRLGCAGVSCSTDAGERLLQRRQWTRMGSSQSLRGEVPVYRLEFVA